MLCLCLPRVGSYVYSCGRENRSLDDGLPCDTFKDIVVTDINERCNCALICH